MKESKKKKFKPKKQPLSISESTISKIAIIILVILPLIYFAPLLSGSKMMYGSDWLSGGYANREWITESIKSYGEIPRWDPMVFCGLPRDYFYSIHTLLYLLLPTHVGWTYIFVFSMMFAGLGMYLYLRHLKFSIYIALFAGIAYMGCGSLLSMTSPGHDGKIVAAAFFPFILLFLHKGLIGKNIKDFLIAGGLGGLAALNAHFQLTYYASIVFVIYLLFHLIWQRRENRLKGTFKIISYSLAGLVLAVGILSIKYLPTLMAIEWGARGTERGYEFATSWSLAPNELIDLITPHFSGAVGISNNYWGLNSFKLDTQYMGILPMILALIAVIFKIKNRYVRFYLGLAVISTLFAFGGYTPLFRIPYYIIPMLDKFRAPSMAFFLVAFSTVVLSAYGFNYLSEELKQRDQGKKFKKLALTLLVVFIILLLFAIICTAGKTSIKSLLKSHFEPVLEANYGRTVALQKMQRLEQNYPDFIKGLWIAFLFTLFSSIIILLLALKKPKLAIITAIAALIVIIDQWGIEKKFLDTVPNPDTYFAPDEIVQFLKKETSIYRVFPLQYEHIRDGYLKIQGIESIAGYVSNPGKRYQEFIGAGVSVMFNPPNLMRNRRFLDILNAKWIIDVFIPEDLSAFDEATRNRIENFKLNFMRQWGIRWEDAHKGLNPVYRTRRGYAVYLNETSLPRAWLASDYEIIESDKVLERMMYPDFNPRIKVILEEDPGVPHQGLEFNVGEVSILDYEPNKITCEAMLSSPGFLVLSENWHPDWEVFVDGLKSNLLKANYILRAVYLPEGRHTIEFRYISKPFHIGSVISIISLIFFAAFLIWDRVSRHYIKKK